MIRARSMHEYRDVIKHAWFEIEGPRTSLELDEEFMDDADISLDTLEASSKELHQSVINGQ